MSLTVIVPIKITHDRKDIISRLNFVAMDTDCPPEVDFLFVDDGSEEQHLDTLRSSLPINSKIVSTGASNSEEMNLARVRNIGAQHASGEFIVFLDVDLLTYPGFYNAILLEIELSEIRSFPHEFLMIPVIYLTDFGHEALRSAPNIHHQSIAINALLRGDTAFIVKYSSGTSAIVVNRHYYLSRGGQDEAFSGWGYEDYEFATRLIRRNQKFTPVSDWFADLGNFMTLSTYRGWKAPYALYGDWLASKGLYLLHIPHSETHKTAENKTRNHALLQQKLKDDVDGTEEPAPLFDKGAGRTLNLSTDGSYQYREIRPYLGQLEEIAPSEYRSEHDLIKIIQENSFNRILFSRPFQSRILLKVFEFVRDAEISFILSEPGALGNTIRYISSTSGKLLNGNSPHIKPQGELEFVRPQTADGVSNDALRVVVSLHHTDLPIARQFLEHLLASGIAKDSLYVDSAHQFEDEIERHIIRICNCDADEHDGFFDRLVVDFGERGLKAAAKGIPVFLLVPDHYVAPGVAHLLAPLDQAANQIRLGFKTDPKAVSSKIEFAKRNIYSIVRTKDTSNRVVTEQYQHAFIWLRGWPGGTKCYERPFPSIGWNSPLFARYSRDLVRMTAFQGQPERLPPPSRRRLFSHAISMIKYFRLNLLRTLKKTTDTVQKK